MAGLLKIPAVLREVEEERLLEYALIENLQRENLNPIEAAAGFQALISDLGLTQQEVAQRVGKQRATVANMLRLLYLPQEVQEMIREGKLSLGHAKAIASLSSAKLQRELATRIVRRGLSVRQAEASVARLQKTPETETKEAASSPARDPNVVAAEEALQKALGTKVVIAQGKGKKGGRLELHFFSDEELERIYQLVLGAAEKSGAPT